MHLFPPTLPTEPPGDEIADCPCYGHSRDGLDNTCLFCCGTGETTLTQARQIRARFYAEESEN